MSSPITFSGFNDIDFNTVLTSLMQQASVPLTSLQSQQSALKTQKSSYGTLESKVLSLQSAADDLGTSSALQTFSATSSDPLALGVSTGRPSAAGRYDVIVQELARAQVTASGTLPDADSTVVATGGTLTIGGVDVVVGTSTTLQQLASAINGTTGIGVHAAVVHTSSTSYRLTLTGNASGLGSAFTIANGLTGGSGVTFTDTDQDGVSGDSAADNAVNAIDAALLVNNIPVTGSSNTFVDVIDGVTFNAYKKDPNTAVQVDVSSDGTVIGSKVQAFVSAYNDFVKFLGDQRTLAAKGDQSSIGRTPMLTQLSSGLRTALLGAHGSTPLTRLSEIGVEFTRSGTLDLNAARLEEALAADEAGVRGLLGGTAGAFPGVSTLLKTYSQATGYIDTAKDRIDKQIKAMDAQIESMQARLALQREALQRQFTEADLAISRLRNQQSSLSTLASDLGSL